MDTDTIRSAARQNRALSVFTVAMAALVIVCVVGLVVDPRLLLGQPIWAKPLKFSISLVLYCSTLALMISSIANERARRWAARLGVVVALAGTLEMVGIVGQVIRGRTSHFDVATPLDTAVWMMMGTTIIVLWLATAGIGVVLLRDRSLAPSLTWAIRLGILVTLLGMAVAFLMTGPTGAQIAAAQAGGGMPTIGAHAVGVPDGGPGLPLVGWSTTGGDLRIAHFVGLHALQGLPLLAFALGALARRFPVLEPQAVRVRLVGVGAAFWAGLVVLLAWQALRAQPLIAPDGLTLGALGALVLLTIAATATIVRTPVAVTR